MSAKDLVRDPDATGVGLMAALPSLLGNFLTWEPESIWLELDHQGIDVPDANRAKIMAGVALCLMPSFYWDALVFEKTALAFDGHTPNPEILEEATPAMLAWSVVESAEIVRRARNAAWEFQHEPRAYAGVVLARAGYVHAPDQLSFAQTALNRQRGTDALCKEVAEKWAEVDKRASSLEALPLNEDPVGVQLARLAAVAHHVSMRRNRMDRDLKAL